MNLKKSDKIIAIVGVVILIVAAIGIIIYAPSSNKSNEVTTPEVKYTNYEIFTQTVPMTFVDEQEHLIKDKLIGNDSENIDISIPGRGVKSINIFVEYKDKNSGLFSLFSRIFPRLGADTLTVTILDSTGAEVYTEDIKGEGNISYNISVNNVLKIDTIRATSETEANSMLQENITKLNNGNVDYTVRVSLNEKESILRPLKWIIEKLGKDTFGIKVTYEQESYSIKAVEDNSNDGNNQMSQNGDSSSNLITQAQAYSYLGYPGFN